MQIQGGGVIMGEEWEQTGGGLAKGGAVGQGRRPPKELHMGAACRSRTAGSRMDEQTEHAVFVGNIVLLGACNE